VTQNKTLTERRKNNTVKKCHTFIDPETIFPISRIVKQAKRQQKKVEPTKSMSGGLHCRLRGSTGGQFKEKKPELIHPYNKRQRTERLPKRRKEG